MNLRELESVLRITEDTPKPFMISIIRGKLEAQHNLLLDVQRKLYRVLVKRRATKQELRIELELAKQMIDIIIHQQQELLKELEGVATWRG